jgi:flagellar hook assembly protein FlgD
MLAYFAPQAGRLKAFVVDGLGRVVRHLLDEDVPKGPQKLSWNGKNDAGEALPDAPYTVTFELDGGDLGAWWGVVTLDELPATAGDAGQ